MWPFTKRKRRLSYENQRELEGLDKMTVALYELVYERAFTDIPAPLPSDAAGWARRELKKVLIDILEEE